MAALSINYDVPTLFRMWADLVPSRDIADALGIPRGSFARHVRHHKLGKRQLHHPRLDTAGNGFEPRKDPTPEEIEERARWIRENVWSKDRREGRTREVSDIPCYSWSPSARRYSLVPS